MTCRWWQGNIAYEILGEICPVRSVLSDMIPTRTNGYHAIGESLRQFLAVSQSQNRMRTVLYLGPDLQTEINYNTNMNK